MRKFVTAALIAAAVLTTASAANAQMILPPLVYGPASPVIVGPPIIVAPAPIIIQPAPYIY